MSLILVCAASAAHAITPATLIDAELQRVPIRFVSIQGDTMRFFDADRRLTSEAVSRYVGVRFDTGPEKAAAKPKLRLANGQVLAGEFAGVDADGHVLWESEWTGRIAVSLDDIAAVTIDAATAALPPIPMPADDTVELTNGDRLTGFIEAVSADGLTLSTNGQELPLAWNQVRRVRLAAPINPAPGVWVTLVDGSRFVVIETTLDSDRLTAKTADGRDLAVAADRVAELRFASDRRLIPLGEVPATVTDGGVVFGVPMPPRIDGDTAALHAPLTLELELPAGAVRFAAGVALDEADLQWADAVVVVSDAEGELVRQRVHKGAPGFELNVPVRGRALTLTLDPGVNGPVRDRLTLTHANVLVEREK